MSVLFIGANLLFDWPGGLSGFLLGVGLACTAFLWAAWWRDRRAH